MESEAAIVRMLEDHRREFEALLNRLRGMTEMGIRILCPAPPESPPRSSVPPGTAYLAALRSRYSLENRFAPEEHRLADRIAASLSDCYTEECEEIAPADRGRLASLYFLTPQHLVETFRNRARLLCPPNGAKVLVSGPWPPYNFAASPGGFRGIDSME
jgi:hypothetical protein